MQEHNFILNTDYHIHYLELVKYVREYIISSISDEINENQLNDEQLLAFIVVALNIYIANQDIEYINAVSTYNNLYSTDKTVNNPSNLLVPGNILPTVNNYVGIHPITLAYQHLFEKVSNRGINITVNDKFYPVNNSYADSVFAKHLKQILHLCQDYNPKSASNYITEIDDIRVNIGEVGLDTNYDLTTYASQINLLNLQIDKAFTYLYELLVSSEVKSTTLSFNLHTQHSISSTLDIFYNKLLSLYLKLEHVHKHTTNNLQLKHNDVLYKLELIFHGFNLKANQVNEFHEKVNTLNELLAEYFPFIILHVKMGLGELFTKSNSLDQTVEKIASTALYETKIIGFVTETDMPFAYKEFLEILAKQLSKTYITVCKTLQNLIQIKTCTIEDLIAVLYSDKIKSLIITALDKPELVYPTRYTSEKINRLLSKQ
ncbi:hypothetical protein [Psittacicella hinzii]|uniref:hypothetical protein n=1 Tax=Psittacicella hinzii TaxID=2028575 RepID=UPI00360ED1FB